MAFNIILLLKILFTRHTWLFTSTRYLFFEYIQQEIKHVVTVSFHGISKSNTSILSHRPNLIRQLFYPLFLEHVQFFQTFVWIRFAKDTACQTRFITDRPGLIMKANNECLQQHVDKWLKLFLVFRVRAKFRSELGNSLTSSLSHHMIIGIAHFNVVTTHGARTVCNDIDATFGENELPGIVTVQFDSLGKIEAIQTHAWYKDRINLIKIVNIVVLKL
mmetsp:Transcript_21548/g.39096  ORF Transcript_21548/g.39096 Transcript_21548/m.39096 type:complete len:218 (+) Transcript_21548:862-1515(+)